MSASPLLPGLWLVSTPIGHADDITLHALDVLARADVLACEDTRRTRKLMDIHGISVRGRPMMSYNDANGPARRPEILRRLEAGESVAYASDAGTPMIADPGYRLVEAAHAAGISVHVVPGASAVLAALGLAGLPTDRFLFAGFLPTRSAARRTSLSEVARVPATLVFFESPRRLASAMADLVDVLGGRRDAAVVREATKLHQEVRRGTLTSLAEQYQEEPAPKGEAVIVVGPPEPDEGGDVDLDELLRDALKSASVRDAAREVAAATGIARKEVYRRAVELSKGR